MGETKKSGKMLLRGVDGLQASGSCTYSIGPKGIEVAVLAQLPGGGEAVAVLQFGPEKDYLCQPAAGIAKPLRCGDGSVMAVWVLSGDKPALFGQLRPGTFDQKEARKHLPGGPAAKPEHKQPPLVPAAPLPQNTAPAGPKASPSFREPASRGPDDPFPAQKQGEPAVGTPDRQAWSEGAALLLGPAAQPEAEGAGAGESAAAPTGPEEEAPAGHVDPAMSPYLVIRRAPRPAPRPPVHSPLWDDVSTEFEKLLSSLPAAHPFNGNPEVAEFAELPTDGAVQCYIGSVVVDGRKVFLQAVPSWPYARPAGFDHSLVSRSGESFWVKYFIQNN